MEIDVPMKFADKFQRFATEKFADKFQRFATKKFALIISLLLPVMLSLSTSATASDFVPFSDDWFNRQFDWVVYVNLSPMDKFLKYKGSTMTPIMRVPVSYRYTPRTQKKGYGQEKRRYEELWFHDGKAVGLHRYDSMPFNMDEQGAIWVQPDGKMNDSIREVANTVVRLVLDIYARKSVLATIVVPKENFENFASALSQFNFFKLSVVYPGGPGNNMSLHLVSQPFGIERYFYYDDSGRR